MLTSVGGKIVDLKCNPKWNAIVITDLHFSDNKTYFSKELIPQTFEELGKLIEKEQSKQIIILGDVFHSSCNNINYHLKLIDEFLQFGLPVFIIPGNHDRNKFFTIKKQLNEKQLSMCKIVNEGLFMRITPVIEEEEEEEEKEKEEEEIDLSNYKNVINLSLFDKIIFTHDAGNGYWLGKKQVIPFLRAIKFHHKEYCDESSFLLTGHTHRLIIQKDEQFGSLSPFHVGYEEGRSYAVVKQVGNKIHLFIVKI
ncbi:hypothetical protein M0813_15558 [Anaeramoeba flamelloides]|uniref:Calcineurin-like phosphoesterase domain-containing protein n=1 Tax=Anaeramoeba flamelloides TaxID=1746091 RepID=A0ABQ8Z1G8_9EUKA|nr:hypothetical protein M0813_15558 [Anaeramoeba flamelloides]